MTQVTCAGLPASWLNGWLAAVGATVLDGRIRLHWTIGGMPLAVLSASEIDPVDALVESWPDAGLLSDLPIAENWRGSPKLQRKVAVEAFRRRASAARGHQYSWTLSSTMTDLCVDENGEIMHGGFDPPAPKGITLHQRLMSAYAAINGDMRRVRDSLCGLGQRVQINGLGFDQARLGSQADATSRWTDPVVEAMAFFGLAVLPVRGPGADRHRDRQAEVRQKGWKRSSGDSGSRGQHHYYWPAWKQPLDVDGIDALLDAWRPEREAAWPRLGVHEAWRSVRFKTENPQDPTRAYGAERL